MALEAPVVSNMKEYEKPIVAQQESLSEGVYGASGSDECWSIDVISCQDWNGWAHVFEVCIFHPSAIHISKCSTATITFNMLIASANSDFPYTVSGNSITVQRESLANAYGSPDNASYKIYVSTGDEATTKSLNVVSKSIECTKSVNVQGGI